MANEKYKIYENYKPNVIDNLENFNKSNSTQLDVLNTKLPDSNLDYGSFLGSSVYGRLPYNLEAFYMPSNMSKEEFNLLPIEDQDRMFAHGFKHNPFSGKMEIPKGLGSIESEQSLLSKYKDEVDISIAATKIGLGFLNHDMLKDYYKSEIETKKRALALNEKIVENKKNIGNAFHS